MISKKRFFSIFGTVFLLSLFLCLIACEHTPDIGPEPLGGFNEKVTALVTTTVRGQLRDNLPKQNRLVTQLPSLEKALTMNQLMDKLKGIDPLKDLAYLIETDVMFELQKPEHQRERISFNNPEIQRQLVSAIHTGMKRALDQLKGGKGGK
ncbi:MAG: hypothetical protein FJ110_11040 [Deltaproteobacteria bacterium]|nr:hypothetical protein [Deltaproteobacteria bacterium]